MKTFNAIDTGVNTLGVYLGIENIETILGVVLLVINLLSLLAKLILWVYNGIRNNKVEESIKGINNEVKDMEDKVNEKK